MTQPDRGSVTRSNAKSKKAPGIPEITLKELHRCDSQSRGPCLAAPRFRELFLPFHD